MLILIKRHKSGSQLRLQSSRISGATRPFCLAVIAKLLTFTIFCNFSVAHADSEGATYSATILSDLSDGANWPAFGRTYGEQHFSPLKVINRGSVSELSLDWFFDLPKGNSVTGPLQIDGKLFFAPGYSEVHALDSVTGQLLWTFDAKAAERAGYKLRQGWGSRGLGWWNGKIYTGTQDGRLIAIDADTGKEVWSVMTVDPDDMRYISGPPRAFNGKVIIGHGGADAGNVRGYVTAYDAETGQRLWRFYTVPGNPADGFENDAMRMAAKTWAGEWWRFGGGGTVWNAITYDEQLDQIYLGTGNGAPWNHTIRSKGEGDNLFLSSIVALNAESGKYIWHYQTNPGETWDYNAAMDMQLAELEIAGAPRKVLMTAPKNGFFYVIDRVDGKLISAENIVPVTWATDIDLNTGRPNEVPGIRYQEGEPVAVAPSPMGAHTWLPMAYNPDERLVYIPTIELTAVFQDFAGNKEDWERLPNNVLDTGAVVGYPPDTTGSSSLVAIDPVTQGQVWRLKTPGYWNGGVLTTAGGVVFQGHIDGSFNAFDASSGSLLWKFDAKAPVLAPPITYRAGGRQYVTVLTGMGTSGGYLGALIEGFNLQPKKQKRRVLTFSLGGQAKLPVQDNAETPLLSDDTLETQPETLAKGHAVYAQYCAVCHGQKAIAVGAASDLRRSDTLKSPSAFAAVVRNGVLVDLGMPEFSDLSEESVEAVRHYVSDRAAKDRAALSGD
ncbi:alcohol dehydrogenase (acceptor) [Luminiphilus syltensis NOR5-1B]|uniref:Alcohol dehydrogenase (Acceptor) n=1 Tax=Luminiphilus syltensis NOR5-1B TaxID=565045 RepID=B8KYK8_9GAMM|nr:PQQ-dependent dehydrogenase, methanol/ethanol family [Luminiphilus syltensis]EED34293.1 alcohol dehydrogenase (acceptor) [Luminiphilus syltensis NOR5-1B]